MRARSLLMHPQLALLLLAMLAGPAAAQAVTWSELEGFVVETEIVRQQISQHQKAVEFRIHDVIKVSIESGDIIDYSIDTTVHGPRGTTKVAWKNALFSLNVTRRIVAGGTGEAIWTFADGTLTFLRTFPAGARRHTIAFSRDTAGLK